jgi:Berberine and berberine like
MQFRSLGGAIADIAADATAFANRTQSELIVGTAFRHADIDHLGRAWAQLAPSFSGAYANFETIPTPMTMRLAFPEDTARRLRELKERYDPNSMFRPWPL